MDETYFRHIVYHRWFEGDIYRPLMSYATLDAAVAYHDIIQEQTPNRDMKIIDLEHIDMGDMLVHEDSAEIVASIRARHKQQKEA